MFINKEVPMRLGEHDGFKTIHKKTANVNPKNKTVVSPAKWVYLGKVENCNLGEASCGKTTGMSRGKKEKNTLLWIKEAVGGLF